MGEWEGTDVLGINIQRRHSLVNHFLRVALLNRAYSVSATRTGEKCSVDSAGNELLYNDTVKDVLHTWLTP